MSNIIEEKRNDIAKYKREREDLYRELSFKEKNFEELSFAIARLNPITDVLKKNELKRQKESLKEKINIIEDGIEFCDEEIQDAEKGLNSPFLRQAFWSLDFKNQSDVFIEHCFSDCVLNTILLSGGRNLEQNFLLKRLRNIARINNESKKGIIDFKLEAPSLDNIWRLVRDSLGIRSSSSPKRVSERIHKMLRQENVIIQFDSINKIPIKFLIPIIDSFWKNFISYLPNERPPYRFFIFLIDRCNIRDNIPIKISCKYIGKNSWVALPPIKRIEKSIIDTWINQEMGRPDFPDVIYRNRAKIFDAGDASYDVEYIAKKICELCNCEDVFIELFEK